MCRVVFAQPGSNRWGRRKNPDIRIAKSIVDYIFRWLGVTFIPGFRESNKGLPYAIRRGVNRETGNGNGVQGPPPRTAGGRSLARELAPTADRRAPPTGSNGKTEGGSGNGHGKTAVQVAPSAADAATALLNRLATRTESSPAPTPSEQFALFQEDAPSCDNGGAITVRAGNCYLCHNCGASMGCS